MNCPTCNVDLKMTERQGVEIDYCPQCRGVWLDRGELDKIIERSSLAEQQSPVTSVRRSNEYEQRHHPREYEDRDEHRDEHYGRPKKKKSFLGEMFDF